MVDGVIQNPLFSESTTKSTTPFPPSVPAWEKKIKAAASFHSAASPNIAGQGEVGKAVKRKMYVHGVFGKFVYDQNQRRIPCQP